VSARDAAVAAARRGWAVFPCLPQDKRPGVDRWEERACADPERVARHWPSDRHNIGIACRPSGLVVIDLDTHGTLPDDWRVPGIHDGRDILAQLTEWAGQPWPATYLVLTPSGGWHLYFKAPAEARIRNSAGQLGPLVDVRAGGGYVVGAGSAVGGKPYEVLDDSDPVRLPGWLATLAAQPRPPQKHTAAPRDTDARLDGLIRTVRGSQPGDRTGPLVWAAHRLREMITDGAADISAGELLVHAAVAAGIRGGERYARYQVRSVLGGDRR
jgi:hypothetical protein